jgi:hypothetical protein
MPERITRKQKQIVGERAGGCCEYCLSQARFSPQPFSVEHITPRAASGASTFDNLALSCQGCNNLKYTKVEGRDPSTKNMVALYHPRQHTWEEHFNWNEDYSLLVGISPTGRASVELLQLNRDSVVNLRRVLFIMGEHPPHRESLHRT